MSYVSEVTSDAPVLWWRMDETSGTVAADSSGNGHDGDHQTGLAFLLDQPGALNSDPTSPAVRLRNVTLSTPDASVGLGSTGQIAFETWLQWTYSSPPTSSNSGVANSALASWGIRLTDLGTSTQRFLVRRPSGGSNSFNTDTNTPVPHLSDGRWWHVVCEWDAAAGTVTLYLGGSVIWTHAGAAYGAGSAAGSLNVGVGGSNNFGWCVDEVAVYDHILGPDRVRAHWHAGSEGRINAAVLGLGLTLPAAHVQVGQWVPASPLDLGLTFGQHRLTQPVRPDPIEGTPTLAGPVAPRDPSAMYLGSITTTPLLVGPLHPPTEVEIAPIRVASIGSRQVMVGPYLPIPYAPDPDPIVQPPIIVIPTPGGGSMSVDASFRVSGQPKVKQASCSPTLNDFGTGEFLTQPPTPNWGELRSFSVAGRKLMTGYIDNTTVMEVHPGEEDAQDISVSVRSTLSEIEGIKVFPEFGAAQLERMGPPTQDVRVFDWTALGIGDWSGMSQVGEGSLIPATRSSTTIDPIWADKGDIFPVPDVWPDQWSGWMWSTTAPGKGWVLLRNSSQKPPEGPVQFWMCAYDYAELWVDGVQIMTCDTPGVSRSVQIDDVRSDYHLIAIRAYTRGMGGVQFSMLPVKSNGEFAAPVSHSSAGWWCSPTDEAYVYTPGAVVRRLFWEAKERGNPIAAKWELDFDNYFDSSGNPWEKGHTIEMDVGMNYLEVLRRLAEDRVDFRETPSGHVLQMWNKGDGSGRSTSVPWTAGVNMTSRSTTREGR